MTSTSRFSTIHGFAIHHVKKIAKRDFGEYLDKVIQNKTSFDIYVCDSVDKEEVDQFIDRWPEFNVFIGDYKKYVKQSKNSR